MTRFDAHVIDGSGRTRVLHCVEDGDDWKEHFQWTYGYYPDDDQLISLTETKYRKDQQ